MVAVQEMKKTHTTQNVSYHRHRQQQEIGSASTLCEQQNLRMLQQQQSQSQSQRTEVETNLDSSEDLSYGPGIVSKLRCRYLSLALRESMEKERHTLENLRRATSLNNLLDRDEQRDDDDDDDEDEEEINGDANVDDEENEIAAEEEINDYDSKTQLTQQNAKVIVHQKIGILKQSNSRDGQIQELTNNKKTATFQNSIRVTNTDSEAKNMVTPEPAVRSRHLKRGNDSLKRARSVEALLCERSPWNFMANRSSLNSTTTSNNVVSIEEKISNARERLVLGVDSMPPKRLTSIISDTERPPPDLVKQTLKLFEATANRRGRGVPRTNGKGEVASKVANYKSIIKENKPIIFPKPSVSPTKRITATKLANNGNIMEPMQQQQQQQQHLMKSSATPPQMIDNNKHPEQMTPVRTMAVKTRTTCTPPTPTPAIRTGVSDSPVTSLMKRLEQLHIDSNSSNVKNNINKKQADVAHEVAELQNIQKHKPDAIDSVSVDVAADIGTAAAAANGAVSVNTVIKETIENENENTNENENENMVAVIEGDDGDANVEAENNDDKADRIGEREPNMQTSTPTAKAETTAAYVTGGGGSSDLFEDVECGGRRKRISKTALENIARAGSTQQFRFIENSSSNSLPNQNISTINAQLVSETSANVSASVLNVNVVASGKQIGIIRPLPTTITTVSAVNATNESTNLQFPDSLKQQQQIYKYNYSTASSSTSSTSSPLTNREIEKNRINEMKNTTSNELPDAMSSTNASLLDTVITSSTLSTNSTNNSLSGYSELDAVTANNSPLWALRKKRQTPTPAAENTSMVFNFSNRKEVPDYIENDGVIFRRRRELPKPNESGFVLLTDLSLETSTDTDYDDFVASPPSPCDVEFENANIVIDGKSSIRQKAKEATFRVQFDDSLTSTFEYPSEASMIVDNDDHHSRLYRNSDDLVRAYENLVLSDVDSTQQQRHHHVAVDEIIPLPTQSTNATAPSESSATSLTKNILGNLPLGSAPLGFYSPVKAPINNLFQLGVTRVPSSNGHSNSHSLPTNSTGAPTPTATATTTTNTAGTATTGDGILNNGFNGNGSILGISNPRINDNEQEQTDSQEYLKPANDGLTIAYSEGAHRTDLLY